MIYEIRDQLIFLDQGSGFDMKYGIRDKHIFGSWIRICYEIRDQG